MKKLKNLAVILSLVPFTAFAASGAAAVVAQAAGKSYSEDTRNDFLKSCSENVEKPICECVLKKLESKYSEDQFKRNEKSLSVGVEDKSYVQFIVDATTSCGTGYDNDKNQVPPAKTVPAKTVPTTSAPVQTTPAQTATLQMSEMELAIVKAIVNNKDFRNHFVDECVDEADDYLGKKQAKQSCNCSYDRILKDDKVISSLLGAVDNEGKMVDFEKWGYNVIAPCLPDQFTPEMETALLKECKDEVKGGDKACKCVVKEIKSRYTVKTLLKAAFEDEKKLEVEMMGVAAQCMNP